jgi:hypothetical protein
MPQTAASQESSVRLPRAVVRQSERIRRLTAESQDTPPVDDETPTAPEADPIPSDEPVKPNGHAEPSQPPQDARHQDKSYWENRCKVLQGMFDAERRTRKEEQAQHAAALSELQEQLRIARSQAPQTPEAIDIAKFFTAQEIEQYGEEQCRVMAAAADKAAREQVRAALDAELKPIREERQRDAEQSKADARRDFTAKLGALVPDFATIDADEAWQAWLAEKDPVTRLVRQQMLNAYVADRDAEATAALFDAFKASRPTAPQPPVAARGRGGPPDDVPAPQPALGYPSESEIKAHYKAAKLGKVTDKERS